MTTVAKVANVERLFDRLGAPLLLLLGLTAAAAVAVVS